MSKTCKSIYLLLILSIVVSCNIDNLRVDDTAPKFIRKSISDKSITVKWFYYGFITSDSPDKVEVYKDNSKIDIIEATWTVVDVSLVNDTIKVKLFNPSDKKIDFKNSDNVVFGYKLIFDSTENYNYMARIPIGKKE